MSMQLSHTNISSFLEYTWRVSGAILTKIIGDASPSSCVECWGRKKATGAIYMASCWRISRERGREGEACQVIKWHFLTGLAASDWICMSAKWRGETKKKRRKKKKRKKRKTETKDKLTARGMDWSFGGVNRTVVWTPPREDCCWAAEPVNMGVLAFDSNSMEVKL